MVRLDLAGIVMVTAPLTTIPKNGQTSKIQTEEPN
jgi:hypothetical protein